MGSSGEKGGGERGKGGGALYILYELFFIEAEGEAQCLGVVALG